MSEYTNFVRDFPARCREVLKMAEGPARLRGREVTLLLMAAASAFIVPFERLKPDEEPHASPHPSGDRERFPEMAEAVSNLLNKPFLASELWQNQNAESWRVGELASIAGTPDDWPALKNAKPVSSQKKVRSLLKIIRNALAHGNLFTKGGSPVSEVIFVSTQRDKDGNILGYSFLQVSPSDFQQLLIRWIDFLENTGVPQAVAAELIDR